jgi:hypothetical protein
LGDVSTSTLKLLFNLLSLAVAVCLAAALCMGAGIGDSVWRHLAEGRLIASQAGIPELDPFHFGAPVPLAFGKGAWLFSLLLYGLHQFAGIRALALLRAALGLALFLLSLATGFRRQARPFSSLLFALAALAAILPQAALSPGLCGLFFFGASLFVMEGDFWPAFFGRWIWLPAVMVAWVNLDPSALLLIPLSLAWALAERDEPSDQRPPFPALALAGTLGILAASALLNPGLWRVAFAAFPGPLDTPLDPAAFNSARPALGLLSLAALCLLASLTLPQGRLHGLRDLLVFLGLSLPALAWRGLLPYACLFAAPMAAARADLCVDALPGPLRALRWLAKAAALGTALFFLPRLLAGGAGRARDFRDSQPRETLDFFEEELLGGNVFSEKDWDGLILWRLQPPLRVFGGAGTAQDREQILAAGEGWEGLLSQSGADFAWLRVNGSLAKAMARSAQWQPVDFDDASVLYAAVSPAHADLIKTWAPRGLRPGDMDDPFDPSRLPQVEADLESRRLKRPRLGILDYYEARLGMQRGEESLARQWLEQGIRADPGFVPSYRLLGELRLKAGDKPGAESFFERAAALGGL